VSPPRLALLGIELLVEGDAAAPVAAALAPLEAAAGAGPSARRIVFATRRVEAPLAIPSPAVFVHGPVRGAREGDALVIGDATARFVVRPGGGRIDADLAPAALAGAAAEVAALHVPIALSFALRHHQVFHLHAAALADGERAVLVAGEAHAGKTTLAIALLEAGLRALCDDAAFLAERGGGLRLQGIARPFHLRPATLRAFPRAAALAGPPDAEGRRDLDPAVAWGAPLRGSAAPGVILFPEIVPAATSLVAPMAPAEALGRLIEASALVVIDGAARAPEHLALLGRLASEAPAYRVGLGGDLLSEPVRVAREILTAAAR
jgi:hypothetical protein